MASSGARRVVAYTAAAAVGVLVLATISERRLASYGSLVAVALLALILGGLNAAMVPLLRRVPGAIGCLPFALVAVVANAALFAVMAAVSPAVRLTPWGVAIGAALVAALSGVVYSLWDEPTDGE